MIKAKAVVVYPPLLSFPLSHSKTCAQKGEIIFCPRLWKDLLDQGNSFPNKQWFFPLERMAKGSSVNFSDIGQETAVLFRMHHSYKATWVPCLSPAPSSSVNFSYSHCFQYKVYSFKDGKKRELCWSAEGWQSKCILLMLIWFFVLFCFWTHSLRNCWKASRYLFFWEKVRHVYI